MKEAPQQIIPAPKATAPPRGGVLQRKCACGGTPGPTGECAACRRKRKRALQRLPTRSAASPLAPPIVHNVLESPGRPLGPALRPPLESQFGHDFSAVRIHADEMAGRSADAVGARAYTVGTHIVFARGQYAPSTAWGRRVLAHELTHVVQQAAAPTPPTRGTLAIEPEGSTAEREAAALAPRLVAGDVLRPAHQLGAPSLQRLPGSRAGGCGLCYGGAHNVGRAAHRIIQASFLIRYRQLLREHHMPVLVPAPDDQENGYLDLAELLDYDRIAIGEIKPDNDDGWRRGRSDLDWYQREIEAYGFQVERMNLPPPLASLPFLTLAPPDCPQLQELFVNPPEDGVYTYWCIPDFRDLIRICDCHMGRRRRETDEIEVPVPVPVPQPHTQPRVRPQTEPQGGPEPIPVPIPAPPIPEQPPVEVPEPPNVIPFPGRQPQPGTEEEPGTEEGPGEELPVAAMVALATMLALALHRAARENASRLLGRALSGTVARAMIYAEAAALIALILVYPERVEARPGSGETALEALFRTMGERGTPVPEELQERIQNDPELRRIFEEGAATGDWTAAQEAVNRDMVQIINDNPDEFSDEDLQLMMEATEATAAETGGASVEEVRAAIERARQGRGAAQEGGEGSGAAPVEESSTPHEAGGEASPVPEEPYPELSAATRERLVSTAAPIRSLFDAMVSQSGNGPAVTDESVERFLQTVPADLTPEEADQLIERIRPAQGQTLDQILSALSRAVQQVRQGEGEADEAEPEAATPPPDVEPPAEQAERITEQEYIRQMQEAITAYEGWDNIPAGEARLNATGTANFGNVQPGGTVDAYVLLRFQTDDGRILRAISTIRLRYIRRTGTSAGDTFVGEVVHATPWVAEDGRTAPAAATGNELEFTLL